ncbi:lysine exporter protein LysE/YggA [Providencia burhodogranariea DSM 19968]|uniref:Lysine exporter protein LysE/YggA n=1 Tax=Providencia burhodogranariea DSM 19968 TaxID=1141662 RepID=K8WN21_9GAMM|nr:lysine exporter protein LysE/YggA [Providencia burhodogranariea DSM 19968]
MQNSFRDVIGNRAWALAGHYIQIIFAKHGLVINYSLSALLIYCAIRILM